MTTNIDSMTVQEIIDYVKQKDNRSAANINSTDIEKIFSQHSILIRCPTCDSHQIIKHGNTTMVRFNINVRNVTESFL